MQKLKLTFWSRFAIVLVCAAGVILAGRYAWNQLPAHQTPPNPNAWKPDRIRASFAGIQVRELDAANSSVVFYFELENTTASDFHLANDSNVVVMSRLKSDNSLSAENHPLIEESAFVPARSRTRIGIVITRKFAWPSAADSAADAKIRDFTAQMVANLSGFVLFDQPSHLQIELPGGWKKLQ